MIEQYFFVACSSGYKHARPNGVDRHGMIEQYFFVACSSGLLQRFFSASSLPGLCVN
jgi:hypothetical protein